MQIHSVSRGDFTLASRKESSVYVDGRIATFAFRISYCIGQLVWHEIQNLKIKAIGGPALGAIPIVISTLMACYEHSYPVINGFTVRSEIKKYGTQKRIEGVLPTAGSSVVIVDDTLTTGQSLANAIQVVEQHGCRVENVIVLVDRQEGGKEFLEGKGYLVTSFLAMHANGELRVVS
ncbi:MAG: orotate phosphoribosyltransferase [Candidatus Wildermuthbacteria bacterium]|nr:orotate phosphoribosyltransferase [Candidatus Wildermuthbacteria bacterium]